MPVEVSDQVQADAGALRAAEFAALRRTITIRGTARMAIAPLTLICWAALTLAVVLFSDVPLAAMLPLAVLVAGFEAIHALHAGAERIGRYLQVQYEGAADGPQWETAAMAVGPSLPGGGVDPLFSIVFGGAAAINLLSALLVLAQPTAPELVTLGLLHAAFVLRRAGELQGLTAPARSRLRARAGCRATSRSYRTSREPCARRSPLRPHRS
jgi:hypothetical protein